MSEHVIPFEREDLRSAYESAYRLYKLMATGEHGLIDATRDDAFQRGVEAARGDLAIEAGNRRRAEGLAESA